MHRLEDTYFVSSTPAAGVVEYMRQAEEKVPMFHISTICKKEIGTMVFGFSHWGKTPRRASRSLSGSVNVLRDDRTSIRAGELLYNSEIIICVFTFEKKSTFCVVGTTNLRCVAPVGTQKSTWGTFFGKFAQKSDMSSQFSRRKSTCGTFFGRMHKILRVGRHLERKIRHGSDRTSIFSCKRLTKCLFFKQNLVEHWFFFTLSLLQGCTIFQRGILRSNQENFHLSKSHRETHLEKICVRSDGTCTNMTAVRKDNVNRKQVVRTYKTTSENSFIWKWIINNCIYKIVHQQLYL